MKQGNNKMDKIILLQNSMSANLLDLTTKMEHQRETISNLTRDNEKEKRKSNKLQSSLDKKNTELERLTKLLNEKENELNQFKLNDNHKSLTVSAEGFSESLEDGINDNESSEIKLNSADFPDKSNIPNGKSESSLSQTDLINFTVEKLNKIENSIKEGESIDNISQSITAILQDLSENRKINTTEDSLLTEQDDEAIIDLSQLPRVRKNSWMVFDEDDEEEEKLNKIGLKTIEYCLSKGTPVISQNGTFSGDNTPSKCPIYMSSPFLSPQQNSPFLRGDREMMKKLRSTSTEFDQEFKVSTDVGTQSVIYGAMESIKNLQSRIVAYEKEWSNGDSFDDQDS